MLLQCPKCRAELPETVLNATEFDRCRGCGQPVLVEAFPALWRPLARGSEAEPLLLEGEASCFYHPQKKAVVPCQACGRFLCALCDCELQGQHLCPGCLESGKQKGKIATLENRRTLYDTIALSLAVYPVALIVGVYFTFVTAPMALFVAIRYWNAPRSVIPRTRIRYILAIILAVAELFGWVLLIYFLIKGTRSHA